MKISVFINLVFMLLHKQINRYIAIFILSTFIIFLLSSVIFIKDSLYFELFKNMEKHSDFVVQRELGGRVLDIEDTIFDEISKIKGVKSVTKRVYGRYKFLSQELYFTIIGVDLSKQNKELEQLLKGLKLENISKDEMILGYGVAKILKEYKYNSSYDFLLADGKSKNIKIAKTLNKDTNLISNDIVIVDINLARDILAIKDGFSSDIIFDVPNKLERDNIKDKLQRLNLNLRITQKEDILREYENVFNYKGGVFLILYLVVLSSFLLILYQRYSYINTSERKQIAILKAIGYSVQDIIKIKISENFIVALSSYIFGVIFAYIFVFVFNAPLIKEIFIGFSNIRNDFIFSFHIEFSTFITLFLFFIIPFLSAILIPVWKIAAINTYESLK